MTTLLHEKESQESIIKLIEDCILTIKTLSRFDSNQLLNEEKAASTLGLAKGDITHLKA